MKSNVFNNEKTRSQDELLQEKRRILLVARIAIVWGRDDLLPELETQLEQISELLTSKKKSAYEIQ
jgi:hypothetical protein